ncbi:MAG: DUF2157 domain-containing protein [Candidatus Marinimicrobia bacterium]|nr:DUF2157 domain-containing protein [Candidatus Neomarinimicrobiota bacterium]
MDDNQIKKWLSEGKISEEQATMMIKENLIAAKEKSSNKFLGVISVLGSIFLGIGIIWIVASNWDGMPDLVKIIVLLGSTGGLIYLGYKIGFNKRNFPTTGHSLILLGAILFGASIFLIAQIYNVRANTSYLIFIWLLGVLPLVYIFQSPLVTFLSCIVFCLWFNSIVFDDFINFSGQRVAFITFFYQTFGLLLFSIGSLHYFLEKYAKVARAYRLIGIYLVICILFAFTFRFSFEGLEKISSELTANPMMISVIYGFIVVMLGINLKFNPSKSDSNLLENTIALAILTVIFALNMAIQFEQYYRVFWLLFNFLFVGLIIVLFRIGYNRRDMKLVNIASVSTFFFLIFKFFDIFSNLLDNGIIWLVFGIALLVGSILFEKKRRKIRESFHKENTIIQTDD